MKTHLLLLVSVSLFGCTTTTAHSPEVEQKLQLNKAGRERTLKHGTEAQEFMSYWGPAEYLNNNGGTFELYYGENQLQEPPLYVYIKDKKITGWRYEKEQSKKKTQCTSRKNVFGNVETECVEK